VGAEELETKGALQLLLFLQNAGKEVKITDIKINAAQNTLYHALETLLQLDLADETRVPPYTRYIKLTDEGKAIAKKLKEIDAILQAKKEAKKESLQ
jgi:hypothetical protein